MDGGGTRASQEAVGAQATIVVEVDWNLRRYMKGEYGDGVTDVGSVLVLTGAEATPDVQVTSCSEYVRTNWSRSGASFLSAMQSVVDLSDTDWQEGARAHGKRASELSFSLVRTSPG